MNKLKRKIFFAECIDTDTISVKCSLPKHRCPHYFHHYNSNGDFNGNRKIFVKSKCKYNKNKKISIKITRYTKRNTLIKENNIYYYSLLQYQLKLKNHREDALIKIKKKNLLS